MIANTKYFLKKEVSLFFFRKLNLLAQSITGFKVNKPSDKKAYRFFLIFCLGSKKNPEHANIMGFILWIRLFLGAMQAPLYLIYLIYFSSFAKRRLSFIFPPKKGHKCYEF